MTNDYFCSIYTLVAAQEKRAELQVASEVKLADLAGRTMIRF